MVVVCLGLAPFLSGLLFSLDETQIWLGDLRVVVVVGPVCLLVCFDLPAFMDQLCPCTNVFLTAYAHLRTEPQSDIGQARREKKTGRPRPAERHRAPVKKNLKKSVEWTRSLVAVFYCL